MKPLRSLRRERQSADAICGAAARWGVRRDRGLAAAEAAEFHRWLDADPRHAAALARFTAAWDMVGRMPAPVAGAPGAGEGRHTWRRRTAIGLAAAAALAIAGVSWWNSAPRSSGAAEIVAFSVAAPRIMTLSDGTIVRLNDGSELAEHFTPAERRAVLVRGEAHFTVAKNPDRPFVVRAGPVSVRAIGTAFNVKLQPAAVEVLVTEGEVGIATPPTLAAGPQGGAELRSLKAGQQALIAQLPESIGATVVVSEIDPESMSRALAWQEPLLRLGGATLAELAGEFQRRSGHRLVLADPELAELHIGGRFRADDVEGFVRVLVNNYGLRAERTADGTILRSSL